MTLSDTMEGMTLFEFAEAEAELIRKNHSAAGPYAHFAEAATAMFSSTVTHVPRTHALFMGVYSMVRKHLLLAVLSALRQHKVQAALNLRQAIEGAVAMLYLIAVPHPFGPEAFARDAKLPDKLNADARKWISTTYPERSAKLKALKDDINENDSHSNIINSYATFDYDSVETGFSENLFFDRDDADVLNISLWNIGHIAAHIVAAFAQVVTDHGGLVLTKDINERLTYLTEANERLMKDIQSKPRWKEAFQDESV